MGLATDVGAGTSFSLLRTLSDACKVLQLQGQTLTPERSLYLVTLGAARALYLDDRLGSLLPGREADFVVLDPGCTPLLRRRLALARTPAERLSALIHLGDDRLIEQTWINGRCLYRRPALPGD